MLESSGRRRENALVDSESYTLGRLALARPSRFSVEQQKKMAEVPDLAISHLKGVRQLARNVILQ